MNKRYLFRFVVSLLLTLNLAILGGCADAQPSGGVTADMLSPGELLMHSIDSTAKVEPSPEVEPFDPDETSLSIAQLNSEAQLAAIEDLSHLKRLDIDDASTDIHLSCPALEIFTLQNADAGIEIDLTGYTSLRYVAVESKQPVAALSLPDSVEEVRFGEGLNGVLDSLSGLPNLVSLDALYPFDLSALDGFDSLDKLLLFSGDWDLSPLKGSHIGTLQVGTQATVDTFAGIDGLQIFGVSDETVTDISSILAHAPDLKYLLLGVRMQYIGDTEEVWTGQDVEASNIQLLEQLDSAIPTEQLRAVVENGGTIRVFCDASR